MGKTTGIVALIFAICVAIGYYILKPADRLPVFNPTDLKRDMVDASLWKKDEGHTVSDFQLTSQKNETVSLDNFKGKVFVTDFFFTRCGSICPKMTEQLTRVQDRFKDNANVMLLSHSVTPDYDTPEVLYEYGEKYGADHDKWIFVTGEADEIFRLARKSYFAVLPGNTEYETDFVHTENMMLVDKEGRIRGYYNGISTEDVDRMMLEIDQLLEEYE